MSNVHIRMVEDSRGDLVDLIYYHHEHAPADVPGWPAPESVDYPVYCGDAQREPDSPEAGCGERILEVPLTRYGELEYAEDPFVRAPFDDGMWPTP
jgi:hypothetical protein